MSIGKTNSRGLLRQNCAKFSSGTILPPNALYSQLGPEKRYGDGFIKKFQTKTCFLGRTKLHSRTLLPQIAPCSPFGRENRWCAIYYKNSNRKHVFWKNEYESTFEAKLSYVFVRNNFAPERTIQRIWPRKEVWGWFHQKIPIENCFLGWTKLHYGTLLPPILTKKIGEVRFSTNIQSENLFFAKTISRGLLRQNWAKFSTGTSFRPEQLCPRTLRIAN